MSWPQQVRKRAPWELVHWERRYKEDERWGYSIREMAAPGGVKCIRTQKGLPPMRPDAALSLLDPMSAGGCTQNWSLRYKLLERPAHRVSAERQNTRYFFFADAYS